MTINNQESTIIYDKRVCRQKDRARKYRGNPPPMTRMEGEDFLWVLTRL